jgi:hypothetical protein
MESTSHRAIAIVGAGAILPDAPNVAAFWENIKNSRYSVTEVEPTAGIRRSTTIPITRLRTRLIQKSAAGFATLCGTR